MAHVDEMLRIQCLLGQCSTCGLLADDRLVLDSCRMVTEQPGQEGGGLEPDIAFDDWNSQPQPPRRQDAAAQT